jgi:uncharacterized UBP type Zn finger protein
MAVSSWFTPAAKATEVTAGPPVPRVTFMMFLEQEAQPWSSRFCKGRAKVTGLTAMTNSPALSLVQAARYQFNRGAM